MATGTVQIKAAEGTCGCGCGEATAKGRTYRQGHDARLRGILGRAYREGDKVAFNGTTAVTAEAALKQHGFPLPPAAKPKAAPKPKAASKPKVAKNTAPKARKAKASTAA